LKITIEIDTALEPAERTLALAAVLASGHAQNAFSQPAIVPSAGPQSAITSHQSGSLDDLHDALKLDGAEMEERVETLSKAVTVQLPEGTVADAPIDTAAAEPAADLTPPRKTRRSRKSAEPEFTPEQAKAATDAMMAAALAQRSAPEATEPAAPQAPALPSLPATEPAVATAAPAAPIAPALPPLPGTTAPALPPLPGAATAPAMALPPVAPAAAPAPAAPDATTAAAQAASSASLPVMPIDGQMTESDFNALCRRAAGKSVGAVFKVLSAPPYKYATMQMVPAEHRNELALAVIAEVGFQAGVDFTH
jgi:hypothetical protein